MHGPKLRTALSPYTGRSEHEPGREGESVRLRIMPSQLELKGPEIFLGLVGAVGTDLRSIGQHLKDELHRVGYSADIIRLSELMLDTDRFAHLRQLTDGPEDERINQLMEPAAGSCCATSCCAGNVSAKRPKDYFRFTGRVPR